MSASNGKPDRLAGLVLAGGRSTRMGRDKADIVLEGATLLDRACTLLRQAGAADVFIAGRPDRPGGLADAEPGGGPARALIAAADALAAQGWSRLLVVPVDMPRLTPALVAALGADPGRACAYDGHPLPLHLPLGALNAEARATHALHALLSATGARYLPPPDDETLLSNINTPGDLAGLGPG